MIPDVLTIPDLRNVLKVGRCTAYKLVKDGKIKHINIGKQIRIPKRYLIDYLESDCHNVHSNGRQNCVSAVNDWR